jgi:GrpB-like predicted nucleotidyltransferase (UPF0157 family)
MKITLEKYNSEWIEVFGRVKADLYTLIGFLTPCIEHIGSTSVGGLSAKPIIDILVGVNQVEDLGQVIQPLTEANYVYYETYNSLMPYRRFFVKHSVHPGELSVPAVIKNHHEVPSTANEHNHRIAHIHILPYDSIHWIRHIAFRDYLREHPEVRSQYTALKTALSEVEWADGNDYNAGKDKFLKFEEEKAVAWYHKRQDCIRLKTIS